MAKHLTFRQRRFYKNYFDKESPTFGNATQSALAAGYKHGADGRKLVSSETFAQLLEESGLNDTILASKLFEGLEAEVIKIATEKGYITDEKSYPDYQTRLKYIEAALKLKGLTNSTSDEDATVHKNIVNIYLPKQQEPDGMETVGKTRAISLPSVV